MMILPLQFDSCIYQNTLIEVEVVTLGNEKESDKLLLLSDIHLFQDINIRTDSPTRRIGLLHKIMKNHFRTSQTNSPCAIQIKRAFSKNSWDQIPLFSKSLPYKTRGLIFQPTNTHLQVRIWIDNRSSIMHAARIHAMKKGHNNNNNNNNNKKNEKEEEEDNIVASLKKRKPGNTICSFEVRVSSKSESAFNLYLACPDKGRLFYDTAYIPTLELENNVREWIKNGGGKIVARCAYNSGFGKWTPHEVVNESGAIPNVASEVAF
jgi:hypothetical protein